MMSTYPRDALARRINGTVFYGWIMLMVGAVGIFAGGPGHSHTFGVFVTPLSDDLGLSRTAVSSAYAVASLAAAFGMPYVGSLIDRIGVRRVLLVAAFALGLVAIGFGMVVTHLVLLTLGFGLLRFLGQGAMMIGCNNLVAQWFSRKRGFALSLMSLGFAASMAIHPVLGQWLTDQYGWREAWLWLGIMTWVLVLPLIILLVQNKPEDLGLLPDGAVSNEDTQGSGTAPEIQSAEVGFTLQQAMRTSAFWILNVGLFLNSALITALFFHQPSVFESHGLSAQTAASMLSLSAVVMAVSMPIIGHMLDRFPTKIMYAGTLLLLSGAMIGMAWAVDLTTAVIYGVIFGLCNGAVHSSYTFIWARFFGRKYLGSIQGAAHITVVVGAAIGAVPLAVAYDLVGRYTEALYLQAILPIFCAVLVLLMKPPKLD